jgi:hypothetical protein
VVERDLLYFFLEGVLVEEEEESKGLYLGGKKGMKEFRFKEGLKFGYLVLLLLLLKLV